MNNSWTSPVISSEVAFWTWVDANIETILFLLTFLVGRNGKHSPHCGWIEEREKDRCNCKWTKYMFTRSPSSVSGQYWLLKDSFKSSTDSHLFSSRFLNFAANHYKSQKQKPSKLNVPTTPTEISILSRYHENETTGFEYGAITDPCS